MIADSRGRRHMADALQAGHKNKFIAEARDPHVTAHTERSKVADIFTDSTNLCTPPGARDNQIRVRNAILQRLCILATLGRHFDYYIKEIAC